MSDKPTEELRLLTSLLQSLGWSGPSDTTIYNGMPNFDTDKTKQLISAWYMYKKKKMKVADDKSVDASNSLAVAVLKKRDVALTEEGIDARRAAWPAFKI
ncbi:hypothetical protein CYMTET_15528 [Cymbomonas tetramitiformis]|uniref:Uncharacterized protein n=1 Tax=Cymbomonas tetramitiformis TaxID=36881 RepID=A0AAE0GE15_9CHLO|nr:hypothetical protein CYMTET_15528 [Cymbomonas tetramitiformis]